MYGRQSIIDAHNEESDSMTLFDRIISQLSPKNFQKQAKSPERRKFTRTSRIEELEGREMLSVTPWSLADDSACIPTPFDTETIGNAPVYANAPIQLASTTELSPLAAAAIPAVKCLKIERGNAHKPTMSTLTLNWSTARDRPESDSYEIAVTNGLAGNRLVVYGTIQISATYTVIEDGGFDVTFIGAAPVGNNIVYRVKIGGLQPATTYRFEVTTMVDTARSAAAKITGRTLVN